MSSISSVNNSYYSTTTGAETTTGNGQSLDKNAFLNLLITQIQYQDPMKPMEDREFIAQLAQFSSLEQMQQVSQKMDAVSSGTAMSAATSFVGRTITAQGPEHDMPITGKVSAVVFEDGVPLLVVGAEKIDLSWVTRVA